MSDMPVTARERQVQELAAIIYEAVCASTDPGVSLWYQSISRPEFVIAANAVLDHLAGETAE